MKRSTGARSFVRRGAALVLLALILPVVILLAAMAINLSYMELNRTEMYISSDAAARAGGREFTLTSNQNNAKTKARDLAALNLVGGQPLLLADSDFVFGESVRTSTTSRYNFTPGGTRPNALELLTRRTAGSPSGPLPLLMPNILGQSTFETQQTSRTTQVDVDVAIVLDRTGSMAYASNEPAVFPPVPAAAPPGWKFCQPVPPNSRWLDAVGAVNAFLNELNVSPSQELVSLTTYNTSAVIDEPLTSSYGNINTKMGVYTNSFCAGKTEIASGINSGRNSLATSAARPWASKVIVLLTDGIQTSPGDPVGAAQSAANEKILIFTISFSAEADQALMQTIATIGLGKHYHAANGANLTEVFRDIARNLPILITR